jgi:hypothetical protein
VTSQRVVSYTENGFETARGGRGTMRHMTIPSDKSPSHAQDRNVSTKRADRSAGSASVDLKCRQADLSIERSRLFGEDRRQHAGDTVSQSPDSATAIGRHFCNKL